jgi:hypothetical protein
MFHIQTVSDETETVKDLKKLGYDHNLKEIKAGSSSTPAAVPEPVEEEDNTPMVVETPAQALKSLITWVNKRGGVVSGDVKVDGVGKGGRGLVATTDIKARETDGGKESVLSLPENVLMSRRTACLYGGLHKVLESRTEMPDDEVLALFLMLERCRAEMPPKAPQPEEPAEPVQKKKPGSASAPPPPPAPWQKRLPSSMRSTPICLARSIPGLTYVSRTFPRVHLLTAHKKKNNLSKKKNKAPPPKEVPAIKAPPPRIPDNAISGKGQWAHYVRSLPDRVDRCAPLALNSQVHIIYPHL